MSSSRIERRQILLVNPNTNTATTEMMRSYAAAELADYEVVGATAARGPRMIVDPHALAESAPQVVQTVQNAWGEDGFDAVIVAAIGDPGRHELEAILDVPVVGIGQASVVVASRQGRPFAMATSTPLLVHSLAALADRHRGDARFTGIQLTDSEPLALAADPEQQFLELAHAVDRCVSNGAEAVIIAGGPLSETARRLAKRDIATIIEPIPSACALIRERLRASGRPVPSASRDRDARGGLS
jgi:allantoin racemase